MVLMLMVVVNWVQTLGGGWWRRAAAAPPELVFCTHDYILLWNVLILSSS